MDWETHNEWAQKMGISEEAAQYVNRIIDDIGELPDDYVSAVKDRARGIQQDRGAKKGNSALHMVIADSTMDHDSSRQKTTDADMAAEIEHGHLKQKGEEYVAAWYLHHHLDYLSEERNSGKSLGELLEEHKEKYPNTYSDTVATFLRENKGAIENELSL
ncbi:hypothetical protein [Halospeciosus flavus]|uniref:Uncharacterized protein n=1 Tax=Halospeciosus flavus TaxID=3032283 RepID=A0ABD5YZP2_9EURY|nr:hypothetical protein [Halospeciosus flavus]